MQIQTDEMRQAMGEADGVVCVAAPRKAAANRRSERAIARSKNGQVSISVITKMDTYCTNTQDGRAI